MEKESSDLQKYKLHLKGHFPIFSMYHILTHNNICSIFLDILLLIAEKTRYSHQPTYVKIQEGFLPLLLGEFHMTYILVSKKKKKPHNIFPQIFKIAYLGNIHVLKVYKNTLKVCMKFFDYFKYST